jgi:hypothetical protein
MVVCFRIDAPQMDNSARVIIVNVIKSSRPGGGTNFEINFVPIELFFMMRYYPASLDH